MTLIYILNFLIPIIFIASFGYWLDRAIRPEKEDARRNLQRIK